MVGGISASFARSPCLIRCPQVKTVYHVRFLTRIQTKFEEELEERLNVIFKHMADTIREFGMCIAAATEWRPD